MTINHGIINHEIFAPKKYLQYIETDGFRAFRDKDNTESACSNYAVLKSTKDINGSIKAAEDFIIEAGSVPKFAMRPDALPLSEVNYALVAHGYEIKTSIAVRMLLENPEYDRSKIKYETKILHDITGAVRELAIFEDEGADFGVKMLDKQLAAGAVLCCAYNNEHAPVAICLAEGYGETLYLSDVYTHPSFRRRGYGAAAVRSAICYGADKEYALIYLYASGEDSQKMYEGLGFTPEQHEHFWAYKGGLPDWLKD